MPSMLDEVDLDARWRAGLDAAADEGRWVEVETRVASHVATRRRRRATGLIGAAAVVALVAVVGGILTVGRSSDHPVRTAAAPGIVLAGTGPDAATSVFFDPESARARTAYGGRFWLGIQTSRPGRWQMTVDENPAITLEVTHVDTEETTAETSAVVEAAPGTYGITITGTPRGATDPEPTVHATLTVLPEPSGPPVATVTVTAQPSLTLELSATEVPAGVVQLDYGSAGGTHALVVDGFPGFELPAATGPGQRTVRLELEPGTYELSCAIPGHREAGERATLTVVAP